MELKAKGAMLKSCEALCYQIAYVLLQNETDAVSAALLSIEELLRSDDFYDCDPAGQRERLKASTIRHCLRLKREAAAENGAAAVKL